MGLNAGLAGKRYEAQTYEVTADAIHAYAAATNEVNPAFTGPDPVAPPAFLAVPMFSTLASALFDPELEVNFTRLVHGQQDHWLHAPIRAGDLLTVEGRLDTVEVKETGERFGVRGSLSNPGGTLVAEAGSVLFIRGTGSRPKPSAGTGTPTEEPPVPEYLFETSEQVDEDQTFRYAEASGDHNPIHLDAEFAKEAAGLPGIIVHGMCTMAFAARAVLDALCGGDPARLAHVGVRFSRPVFPGQTLTTRGWRAGQPEADGSATALYAFETLNDRGQAVITGGVAEVRPPRS